ncbi:hypothetical protein CRUP_036192 [Coryphaenoides rupestris]|nr:hypothetical protein CRUP_036192 [Coryphaenoides rupestris]
MPKRRPLPNTLLLGPAPTKPSRPPYVNLERFRRDAAPPDPDVAPPPPASRPSSGVAPPTPAQPVAPSLPPRHPGVIEPDEDDNYDDVAVMTKTSPPTLPSTTGRPALMSKSDEGSDGELYEDLDERWEAAELREQEDKKKKEKEEKKRLEAEKKEQKEREKKELEAKKKFKLAAPIDVIQRARVTADSRGSRTDLALKNGDWVDLVRVQDNPEGRWLARADNGSFGYVKSDCVEVDLDIWKQQQPSRPPSLLLQQDVYDDVDHVSENSSSGPRGSRIMLPPPPEEEGEIYDDVIDAGGLDVSVSEAPKSSPKSRLLRMFERKKPPGDKNEVPPPSQFTAEGNPDHGEDITEEIYDDIDSQVAPPPLPPASGRRSSFPSLKPNMEEIDPKLKKKFEKEEKEFRKKFKYEGEIQVLYEVTIIPTLSMKKFGGKDLSVRPGETLDVIIKAVDGKLVCRSEEGKCEYCRLSVVF